MTELEKQAVKHRALSKEVIDADRKAANAFLMMMSGVPEDKFVERLEEFLGVFRRGLISAYIETIEGR